MTLALICQTNMEKRPDISNDPHLFTVVVWDREDYLREANSQPSDKDVCQGVNSDAEGPFMKVIKTVLRKIRNREDISNEALDYFLMNNAKLRRFQLVPKIHKRLPENQ